MAKFKFDKHDNLVADSDGNLDYDEAVNAIVEATAAEIEAHLWEMVDQLEVVVSEEVLDAEADDDDEFDVEVDDDADLSEEV
jgi:hypothetical protein